LPLHFYIEVGTVNFEMDYSPSSADLYLLMGYESGLMACILKTVRYSRASCDMAVGAIDTLNTSTHCTPAYESKDASRSNSKVTERKSNQLTVGPAGCIIHCARNEPYRTNSKIIKSLA
jgi:hypothetical protein